MRTRILAMSLLMVSLCYGQAVSAKVIKIATLSPDGTAWMKSMREGAAEIKKRTQGRVVIKFYPGGVMGNDKNVLRKIRIGQLQGGAVTAGGLSDIYPDIDIYGLPYLFENQQQVDTVRKIMDEHLLSGLEKKGFVGFGIASGGFTYMMSNEKVTTVEQAKQKKIWIPSDSEVGLAVFDAAEISPVPLPLSDVLTGLQTSLIDTVFASPIGAIALQWHTKVKYVIDVPLTYLSALMVISKKTFYRLKEGDRKIARDVMSSVFSDIEERNRADNISARQALMNKGIEFVKLPAEDAKVWLEIGKKAMKKLEKKNSYTPLNYNRLMEAVKAAR